MRVFKLIKMINIIIVSKQNQVCFSVPLYMCNCYWYAYIDYTFDLHSVENVGYGSDVLYAISIQHP